MSTKFRVSMVRVVIDYFEIEVDSANFRSPSEAIKFAEVEVHRDPAKYQLGDQVVAWTTHGTSRYV